MEGYPLGDIHSTTRIDSVVLDGQLIDDVARRRMLDQVRLEVSQRMLDAQEGR